MRDIEIHYNPYKMKTTMRIEGIDVCQSSDYSSIKEFIEHNIPLQTWIEPIPYLNWNGFVDEISDPENNDEVHIIFSGRKIDFQDLQYAIEAQNAKRSEDTRVRYQYEHKKVLDDKILSQNIEEVVRELKSDRFRKLVKQRKTQGLNEKYKDLDTNYKRAKENEFYIVFAGVYSSGKSTLLNALIRHDVLPTSSQTCTSKNCRIKHNPSLKNKIALTCYDDDKNVVIPKQIFDTDKECAEEFLKISPVEETEIQELYINVSTMELEVDLSHLYPKDVSDDKFTIVLIDTPGMDSAQSSKNGNNRHAETALEAIGMDSKPMILLCADANKYEDKSIGEFMREIIEQSKKEESGFNDRFLFLMNKSDAIEYKKQYKESAENTKKRFAEYLTDPSKWNIGGDEEEMQRMAEDASHFVPRIFMTAARVAYAIEKEAIEEDDDDSEMDALYETYRAFRKKVCKSTPDPDYCLAEYCDIPNYRKSEIEIEYKNSLQIDKVQATKLQCGLVSVESAIKDYINRYAYPIKVRDLLETFEDILDDVNSFTNATLARLKQAKVELGEKNGERKEVSRRKENAEEKIAALEIAQEKIRVKLDELDSIHFDSEKLGNAIKGFIREINENTDIQYFREHIYSGVNTGQKSRNEVEADISSRIYRIKRLFDSNLCKTNEVLEDMKKQYDNQIQRIFNVVRDSVAELENAGVFSQGEYKFTDSVWWKVTLGNISSDQLISDVRVSIVDRTTRTRRVRNAKKDEWGSSWNPFKKFGSLFMESEVEVEKKVDGSYKTTQIMSRIINYTRDIEEKGKQMQNSFVENLDKQKEKVNELVDRILKEVSNFLEDIRNQEMRIESLGGSIIQLDEEIRNCNITYAWLNSLKRKIEEV
jgi:GTPase SAR1 family protein